MALNAAQRSWLNEWCKTQPNFSNGQIDGSTSSDLVLGTQLSNGQVLDNVYRDKVEHVSFTLPAPSGAAATLDIPIVTALTAGTFVSASLVATGDTTISNTSTTTSNYTFVVRRLNNTAASISVPVPTLTGLTTSVALRLPTGSDNALMAADGMYSMTASANTLRINAANTTLANSPAVGDWFVVGATNNQYIGAASANVGLYLITAASVTSILGTKQTDTTAPANVVSVTAIASSIAAVRLIKQTEASFSGGDMLAVRVAVPAASGASTVTAQFSVQLRLRYN